MQRIAIVDPNEASRESLRTMLLGVDFVWLEAECARYEYFFDVIKQSAPDLVIVALDGDKNKALGMVGQLATRAGRSRSAIIRRIIAGSHTSTRLTGRSRSNGTRNALSIPMKCPTGAPMIDGGAPGGINAAS